MKHQLILIGLIFLVSACGKDKPIDSMNWDRQEDEYSVTCNTTPPAPYSLMKFQGVGHANEYWQLLSQGEIIFDECGAGPVITKTRIYGLNRTGSNGYIQGNYLDSLLPLQETIELRTRAECSSAPVTVGTATTPLNFVIRLEGSRRCPTSSTFASTSITFR